MARRELKVCLFCGADTTARDSICRVCIGHGSSRHMEDRDRQPMPVDLDGIAEDDYGDESGPDDVYQERTADAKFWRAEG